MTALLCPLCSQPRFTNLESLRTSLVNAATQSISCPICSEVLQGLDKLTIHLFAHTLHQEQWGSVGAGKAEGGVPDPDEGREVPRACPEVCPEQERARDSDASTVNLEDLGLLTSWEGAFGAQGAEGSGEVEVEGAGEGVAEDGAGLSEYMSDLLEKKLPVSDFVFAMDSEGERVEEGGEGRVGERVEEGGEGRVGERAEESFKCPTCDFSFQNSIILSMHRELVHPRCSREGEAAEEAPPDGGSLEDFVLPRYDCHLCSKSFKMKGSLLVHYRVAHLGAESSEALPPTEDGDEERNFRCSICTKSFKKEQHVTQHIKTHQGKQWQCETCNKHFTTKYFLKKHQRLHTGEMPYSCQTCNKTFTFQQSYHKHLLYHSDEKPHQCSQCGRAFKELSTLHNHQRIHSGEKPFACETCGKCFRQRVSYIVHQRIHTGALPYQCTACNKKFRYKVSQRSHKCAVGAQGEGAGARPSRDLVRKILERRGEGLRCTQ